MLGTSPLDRAAYVATSVAIDVFKVSLPRALGTNVGLCDSAGSCTCRMIASMFHQANLRPS
jgi:hypothetical protein